MFRYFTEFEYQIIILEFKLDPQKYRFIKAKLDFTMLLNKSLLVTYF